MGEFVDTKGFDELVKIMRSLGEKTSRRILPQAVRAGARPIIKEAKRLVPVDTGKLKSSIGVVRMKTLKPNLISFRVGPKTVKKSKKRLEAEFATAKTDKEKKKISKFSKDGYYGFFVEFGTKHMKAQPFLRPALMSKYDETVKVAREALEKKVLVEVKKT